MAANRAENAPFTMQRIRPAGAQRAPASISPVADELLMYTGLDVPKITCRAT